MTVSKKKNMEIAGTHPENTLRLTAMGGTEMDSTGGTHVHRQPVRDLAAILRVVRKRGPS